MNQQHLSSEADDLAVARTFVEHRLSAQALRDYPGPIPETLSRSYAIQDQAIALYPSQVVGWKVGGVPVALQGELGAHRVAGAVFTANTWAVGSQATALPVIEGGFAAIEAEFIARIGADVDPARLDWSLEAAADQIDVVFIGVELAGSPLPTINDLGPTVTASDFGNNGGLLIGPELTDWRARLETVEVETVINAERVGRGGSASLAGGALESVRFLLEHGARRGRPLTAGTLISTGAVTGVHRVGIGDEAVCRFDGVGEIRCRTVKAQPRLDLKG